MELSNGIDGGVRELASVFSSRAEGQGGAWFGTEGVKLGATLRFEDSVCLRAYAGKAERKYCTYRLSSVLRSSKLCRMSAESKEISECCL